MKVVNQLMPSERQKELLTSQGPDGPVFMINLVKFKDLAVYEDGRESNITGKDAYGLYGQEVVKMLPRFNAEVILSSNISEIMIGEIDELWDEMTVVKYASRKDLADMTSSQEWYEINIHRLAGIKGQLNIESVQSSE